METDGLPSIDVGILIPFSHIAEGSLIGTKSCGCCNLLKLFFYLFECVVNTPNTKIKKVDKDIHQ